MTGLRRLLAAHLLIPKPKHDVERGRSKEHKLIKRGDQGDKKVVTITCREIDRHTTDYQQHPVIRYNDPVDIMQERRLCILYKELTACDVMTSAFAHLDGLNSFE